MMSRGRCAGRASDDRNHAPKSCLAILPIIIITIKAQDHPRRPQMRCPAVRKCSCLYTMYHINNNVFSSVLKVVRLQPDIRNTVGKLLHTEGPDKAKLLSPQPVFVSHFANAGLNLIYMCAYTTDNVSLPSWKVVGCLTSHSTHYRSVISGVIKPVSCRDQAWIPPEPLHHVIIIQL